MTSMTRPVGPVRPEKMEIIFIYPCPFCGHKVPILAPTESCMIRCDGCHRSFPGAPVDGLNLRFLKVMTDEGRACVDQDYL
ncbi:MAG: hypothetical protein EOM25_06550 [Deltaproteobacteria bacterium]|nr:hypothetical protein [Deltaproteobacteria bacterium]